MDKKIHNNQVRETQSVMNKYVDEHYECLDQLPAVILKWIDQYSQDSIVVWDTAMKIIYMSNRLQDVLNYDAADVYGHAWRQIISEEDALCIDSLMFKETATELTNLKISNHFGKKMVFECKIESILDQASKQTYLIGLLKNVAQVNEAEELMIRSEKMSIAGQLAAGIAHEIRNPLTSLKGFLQLLKAGGSKKDAYINIMSEEIDKIEAITSEFLFVSKPLTDKKQACSVQSMLGDVTLLLNTQASLRNITVTYDKTCDVSVFCDGSQIKQVFINIIKNAIEATESAGAVNIVTQSRNGHIEIDIIDEGPGISETEMDKIGEPFYTTKQEGTGLGIMITKQIIEKHGGQLDILQNKDKGSTFRVILPEYQEE